MDDYIPHIAHFPPGKRRPGFSHFNRHMAGRLADDRKIVKHRLNCPGVPGKLGGSHAFNQFHNFFDGFQDVDYPDFPVSRRHARPRSKYVPARLASGPWGWPDRPAYPESPSADAASVERPTFPPAGKTPPGYRYRFPPFPPPG